MVFGEIAEPTTRALIEDDFTEFTDSIADKYSTVETLATPEVIDDIFFVETVPVINFFCKSIISDTTPIYKIEDIEIYKLEDAKYIIVAKLKDVFTSGLLIKKLLKPWIEKATNIYIITSASIVLHHSSDAQLKSKECFIRTLSTGVVTNNFEHEKLEPPNLVTGLSANILSFCVHNRFNCLLFVAYIDLSVLDSLNTSQLLELAVHLNLPVKEPCKLKPSPPNNNLYL